MIRKLLMLAAAGLVFNSCSSSTDASTTLNGTLGIITFTVPNASGDSTFAQVLGRFSPDGSNSGLTTAGIITVNNVNIPFSAKDQAYVLDSAFTPGSENFSIIISGDNGIPGVSTSITQAPPLRITSLKTNDTISKSGLTLKWSPANPGGTVGIELINNGTTTTNYFDDDGSADIPKAALDVLKLESTRILLFRQNQKMQTVNGKNFQFTSEADAFVDVNVKE